MPLHRVWEYRDIGRLFITVGGERVIIGVLRWGWVEVILRVSLEVILHHLLRQLGSHSPGEGGRQRLCQEPSESNLLIVRMIPTGVELNHRYYSHPGGLVYPSRGCQGCPGNLIG